MAPEPGDTLTRFFGTAGEMVRHDNRHPRTQDARGAHSGPDDRGQSPIKKPPRSHAGHRPADRLYERERRRIRTEILGSSAWPFREPGSLDQREMAGRSAGAFGAIADGSSI